MQKKPGKSAHRDRKPPVSEKPVKIMDRRIPDRVIDTSGCIKVCFKDKNKTTMYARDEDHVVRIRKVYKDFEKRFGSELVYP